MNPNGNNSPREKQGGGRKAAALFCLAAIFAIVLAFGLIYLSLGNRDRIIRFVPSDAVLYVHAQGNEAITRVRAFTPLIPALSANEIGLFVLEIDGHKIWNTALMWNHLTPPSDNEINALKNAGAIQIEPTFYILRADEGPIIMSEGRNGSLAERRDVARALATMRSISRTQAYIDTDAFLKSALDSEIFPIDLGCSVFALTKGHDAPSVLMTSVAEAERYAPLLGFRLPDARDGHLIPALIRSNRGGTSISLTTAETGLNPTALLLYKIEELRREAGTPDGPALDQARSEITADFSGPISILVRPNAEHEDTVAFAALLPDATPEKLRAHIARYLSAALPRRDELKLPDGRMVNEFIVEPGLYDYENGELPGNGFDDTAWQGYPINRHDAGTLIASDKETLDSLVVSSSDMGCITGGWPTLVISELDGFISDNDVLSQVLDLIHLKDIVIQKIGDNIVYFCG
ncbi:MAG: hypothetical protein U9Q03_03145 [Patescibacteria group bacterium]|nr:hypothetical protein [Patescibacteria group bacterium]